MAKNSNSKMPGKAEPMKPGAISDKHETMHSAAQQQGTRTDAKGGSGQDTGPQGTDRKGQSYAPPRSNQ